METVTRSAWRDELVAALAAQQRRRDERQRLAAGGWGGPVLDAALVGRCQSADPGVALPAVRTLRAAVDGLEGRAVARARGRGWRWAEIARVLGRSRQAVHQRYASAGD